MNLLFSCIGKRGYIADFFRPHLGPGDRIVGSGNSRWTPGFARCDAAFLLPDIASGEYVPSVLELCATQRIDAVLSFNDNDVYALAHARDEFSARGITLLLPSAAVAEITYDKYRMFEFARANGFSTPRTALSPADAAGFAYPLYVKPRFGSGSADTFVARNEREMATFFDYREDMIIQETVTGEPFNIDVCTDLAGRPVGVCTWKKYRSRLGETEQAETFRDPAAIEWGLRLARALAATGPMDVDAFRQDGRFVVLEANARFGGGYPVSHLAGADFPRLLTAMVRDGRVEPDFGFSTGIVMMKRLEVIGGDAERFFRDGLRLR
jgi:carbamoyl-phosphate synthase large subunit